MKLAILDLHSIHVSNRFSLILLRAADNLCGLFFFFVFFFFFFWGGGGGGSPELNLRPSCIVCLLKFFEPHLPPEPLVQIYNKFT